MSAVNAPGTLGPPLCRAIFRLDGRRIPRARWVAVVGAFNQWNASAHRLTRGLDGWWSITLTLPPGRHPYLFIVDDFPHNDPEDEGRVPCEWGGDYSVRNVL